MVKLLIKGKANLFMKKMILAKIIPLAASLALFAGCATYESPSPESPPPPQAEVVPPQPDVTFVWTPGYWDWRGHWVWVHGVWGPRPHPGAVWVQGGWEHRGHRYVWHSGHWR
jgi:WXXGXW repeat (2 copies)